MSVAASSTSPDSRGAVPARPVPSKPDVVPGAPSSVIATPGNVNVPLHRPSRAITSPEVVTPASAPASVSHEASTGAGAGRRSRRRRPARPLRARPAATRRSTRGPTTVVLLTRVTVTGGPGPRRCAGYAGGYGRPGCDPRHRRSPACARRAGARAAARRGFARVPVPRTRRRRQADGGARVRRRAAGGRRRRSGRGRRAGRPRHAPRPRLGDAERRVGDARRRHRRAGRRGGDAHAVRGPPPRLRDRGGRHDARRDREPAAQDARGARRLRPPDPAHRAPGGGAADRRLALPARPLRGAERRAPRRAPRGGGRRRRRPRRRAGASGWATPSARGRWRSATVRRCATRRSATRPRR